MRKSITEYNKNCVNNVHNPSGNLNIIFIIVKKNIITGPRILTTIYNIKTRIHYNNLFINCVGYVTNVLIKLKNI